MIFLYFFFLFKFPNIYYKGFSKVKYLFRFQKACVKYGVPDVDLFQAVDLMERKNISQVTNTIFAIGRTVSLLLSSIIIVSVYFGCFIIYLFHYICYIICSHSVYFNCFITCLF